MWIFLKHNSQKRISSSFVQITFFVMSEIFYCLHSFPYFKHYKPPTPTNTCFNCETILLRKIRLRFYSRSNNIRLSGLERTQLRGCLKSFWDMTYPRTSSKLMAKTTRQCSIAFPSIPSHLRWSKMQPLYILLLKHINLNKKIISVTPIIINKNHKYVHM